MQRLPSQFLALEYQIRWPCLRGNRSNEYPMNWIGLTFSCRCWKTMNRDGTRNNRANVPTIIPPTHVLWFPPCFSDKIIYFHFGQYAPHLHGSCNNPRVGMRIRVGAVSVETVLRNTCLLYTSESAGEGGTHGEDCRGPRVGKPVF